MPMKISSIWLGHLSALLLLTTISCASHPPKTIGLKNGRLRSCPNKPNCVSSEFKTMASWVEPLTFDGKSKDAWEQLKISVLTIGGNIEKDEDIYLWATFRSKVFRFVDDMEFRMDTKNKVIHLRSASRVGYSDLGVNRRRVKKLRSNFYQKKSEHM